MQNLMQLNFISTFALCKAALPHLRRTQGNIINMASWVGGFGQSKACTCMCALLPCSPRDCGLCGARAGRRWLNAVRAHRADAATKGAIIAFTKALAIDEAEHHVRVNCVSPGNIWTPLWKVAAEAEEDPVAARAAGERVQALGRMGSILETGRLCLCIAADLTFTTGVDHVQSGGAEIGYGLK
jgi:NAD(P)-dependent dehydrogenase (short-subunit alcohol dehydrogenase family)